MNRNKTTLVSVIVSIIIAVTGCGRSYNTLNMTQLQLEELADERFNVSSFIEASELYTELMFRYPGAENTDLYLFKLGETYMNLHYWADALFYFNKVQTDYSGSILADDCAYLTAETWWEQRSDYRKDLAPVLNAKAAVEQFFEHYPGSSLCDDAILLQDSISSHLSRRQMFIGNFYAHRNLYDAALLYLREALDGFGNTRWKPDILISIAIVYDKMGNEWSAQRYYERARDECELSLEQTERIQEALEELER